MLASVEDDLAKGVALYLAFIVVVMLACAFGASAIMRGKGRSGVGGFFLGFFLGLIGLLIAGLLPATPEYEAYKMQRQMQLLGMPVPATTSSSTSPVAATKFQRKASASPISVAAVFAAAASAVAFYLTYWSELTIDENYGLCAGVVVLLASLLALTSRNEKWSAVCIGASLFTAGFGVTSVLGEYYDAEEIALLLDLLVFAAAVMTLVGPGATPSQLPKWWSKGVGAIGAVGVVATLIVGGSYQGGGIDLFAFKGLGLVIATIAAIRATTASLALAAGWGLFGGAMAIFSELRMFSLWTSRSVWSVVIGLVVVGLGGLSTWALRRVPPSPPPSGAATVGGVSSGGSVRRPSRPVLKTPQPKETAEVPPPPPLPPPSGPPR